MSGHYLQQTRTNNFQMYIYIISQNIWTFVEKRKLKSYTLCVEANQWIGQPMIYDGDGSATKMATTTTTLQQQQMLHTTAINTSTSRSPPLKLI